MAKYQVIMEFTALVTFEVEAASYKLANSFCQDQLINCEKETREVIERVAMDVTEIEFGMDESAQIYELEEEDA